MLQNKWAGSILYRQHGITWDKTDTCEAAVLIVLDSGHCHAKELDLEKLHNCLAFPTKEFRHVSTHLVWTKPFKLHLKLCSQFLLTRFSPPGGWGSLAVLEHKSICKGKPQRFYPAPNNWLSQRSSWKWKVWWTSEKSAQKHPLSQLILRIPVLRSFYLCNLAFEQSPLILYTPRLHTYIIYLSSWKD